MVRESALGAGIAAAAIADTPHWDQALGRALGEVGDTLTAQPDLVLLFAAPAYAQMFSYMAAVTQERTGAAIVIGCSGQGVIGPGREVEERPALSVLAASLPGARLHAVHISQATVAGDGTPEAWHALTGVDPEDVNAWLIFSDPFTIDTEALLRGLARAYPGVPLIGGVASGSMTERRTHLFLNGDVLTAGAVLLAIGGAYTVRTVVSQGAQPIGAPWTVTGAHENVLETIGGRPAYEVLVETFHTLAPEMQTRARANLLVGLAMDEYRDEFGRGDFLIRNLLGGDQQTGALAISAYPRVGQTIQFQVRDADAADEELRAMLVRERAELGERRPVAALLCACNGRGLGLFGAPDHDARTLAEELGPVPVAGFFCNGEIGPVAARHSCTASPRVSP